jgi:hypothetical protein
MQKLKSKETLRRQAHKDFAPLLAVRVTKRKLTGSAAVDLNSSKAFGGGNWRKK